MKNHSSMTVVEFLFSTAWKFAIGFIWYKNLLFRVLPHQSTYDSLQCLFIMALISLIVYIIMFRHRRNSWTSTACFVLPFGIYTIATYATTATTFIRVVAGTSLFISLVYSIPLLTAKIPQPSKVVRRRVFRKRISRCAYSLSCITAVAMLILMVGIGWNGYFGTALVSSKVKAEVSETESMTTDTIAANMDTVLKLRPSVWEQQSTRKRLDILQTVCNIEVHYLGLSDPVTVQGDNLSPYTLGSYADDSRLIRINLDHIENDPVEEVLSTLLHEVHHSYEHRLAEAYNSASPEHQNLRLFRDASHYSQEVDNYINPREDYYGYMSQYLEMDSEIYAELGVQEYYRRINCWLEENNLTIEATETHIS